MTDHDPQPRMQHSSSSFSDSFVKVDYPAYPVLAPTNMSNTPSYFPGQPTAQPVSFLTPMWMR